jgi:hypothetical protein
VFTAKKSIQTETQHGESLSRLQQLEQGRYQRTSIIEDTVSQAPVFTQPMRDIHVAENQAAHFEARLIPVGDSKLKVRYVQIILLVHCSSIHTQAQSEV